MNGRIAKRLRSLVNDEFGTITSPQARRKYQLVKRHYRDQKNA